VGHRHEHRAGQHPGRAHDRPHRPHGHLPEYSGKDVKPQILRNYDGQDIILPGDETKVIRVAESKGLAELKGKTLITTDGTTLLGADDKAGVAVIMTLAQHLQQHPSSSTARSASSSPATRKSGAAWTRSRPR